MPTIPENPDWFVYRGGMQSKYPAFRMLTATAYGSQAAGRYHFNDVDIAGPIAFNNIVVFKSLNASVPAATSQASTGSEGFSIGHTIAVFVRQDWSSNSSNMSCILTASGGITATMGYSSTSQQFGMSWNADASGGTSAFTTTSNDGNWSRWATGAKIMKIPVPGAASRGTTLSAGEYFVAHACNTTSATSNSNVTLLSVSGLALVPQSITFGALGSSVAHGDSQYLGMGIGALDVITTSTTMAGSLSANPISCIVHNFSNAF